MNTKDQANVFIENRNLPWDHVDKKIRRKIIAYDDNLMLVKVQFEKGGIGPLHQHAHSQATYIESGVFEVEIADETKILKAGDAYFILPNILHGAICLEEGVLLDVFSPMREDFVK
jgi:quercetin dioxygenase-like cupin family protein